MIKIFTSEEQKQMGEMKSKDIEAQYPNKAFIMINTRDNYKIIKGMKCVSGVIGTLYAMADYDDKEEYSSTIEKLTDTDGVGRISVFTSFGIKDGMYYVEK